jgi:hypothetical protein
MAVGDFVVSRFYALAMAHDADVIANVALRELASVRSFVACQNDPPPIIGAVTSVASVAVIVIVALKGHLFVHYFTHTVWRRATQRKSLKKFM